MIIIVLYLFIKSEAPAKPYLYFRIYDEDKTLLENIKVNYNKEIASANYGIYDAIRFALFSVKEKFDSLDVLKVFSYNEVVIKQLNQEYQVKKLIEPYNKVLKELEEISFEVEFRFIPKKSLKKYF